MKTTALLMLLVALSGCATTGKYESKLQSMVGKSGDDLVQEFGAPISEYKREDGGKLLAFRSTSGPAEFHWCNTTFMLDSKNVVTSWKKEGNNCRSD